MSLQLTNPKLRSLDDAVQRRWDLKEKGETVVLTNGCFDLIHTGHIYFLQKLKDLGDRVFVALNAAVSVRALKGETRPIQGDLERAYALAAFECIDTVLIFDTPRLTQEIEQLKPDVYGKAGDYTLETLNTEERQVLQKHGADIQFIPFLEGFSTTSLIEKINLAAKASKGGSVL